MRTGNWHGNGSILFRLKWKCLRPEHISGSILFDAFVNHFNVPFLLFLLELLELVPRHLAVEFLRPRTQQCMDSSAWTAVARLIKTNLNNTFRFIHTTYFIYTICMGMILGIYLFIFSHRSINFDWCTEHKQPFQIEVPKRDHSTSAHYHHTFHDHSKYPYYTSRVDCIQDGPCGILKWQMPFFTQAIQRTICNPVNPLTPMCFPFFEALTKPQKSL